MKNKTERAARKAGSRAKPKPPFPRQHQTAPGLESKLKPRPRYEAEAYKAAGKLLQQDQPWSDCVGGCEADTRARFCWGENQ